MAVLDALNGGACRFIGPSSSHLSSIRFSQAACLKECGLVVDRHEGRQAFYRAAHTVIVDLLRSAELLLAATGEQIALSSNYEADGPG
jgi:DNA-binding transcriptional ArsR family regulator